MEPDTNNTSVPSSNVLSILGDNINGMFLVLNGMIVLFMQCGFAFLEVGSVRSKNSTNILVKNLLDLFIAGIAYMAFGHTLAFGEDGNGFISYGKFSSPWINATDVGFEFFQFAFAATAATIVSGAVAERCHIVAYVTYSFTLVCFIYPVVAHWAWDDRGWLYVGAECADGNSTIRIQYTDIAGSGVIHAVGGSAALVAATLIGPRLGRYNSNGKTNQIRGHSVPFAALGGFILLLGFLGTTAGSHGSLTSPGDGARLGLALANLIISASFSAGITLVIHRFTGDLKWRLLLTINGALTGMVSICGGCSLYYPWAAAIIGAGAAAVFNCSSLAIRKAGIDDPLDAVSVHLGGGSWGVIAVAVFREPNGILFAWTTSAFMSLVWQLAGLLSIIAWTTALSFGMFASLRYWKVFRVRESIERKGLDIPYHGEPAYPLESYGHGWVENIQIPMLQRDTTKETIIPDDLETTENMLQKENGRTENPERRNSADDGSLN